MKYFDDCESDDVQVADGGAADFPFSLEPEVDDEPAETLTPEQFLERYQKREVEA